MLWFFFKQYHTALPSKQYSTYTVTIASFSCLPREAPFLREIRTSHQVCPLNCSGVSTLYRQYIYFFMRHLQHQDIDGHLLRLYIFIYVGIHTYIMNITERQMFRRSPSAARTRTFGTKCFCFSFFVFLFFSRSFVNKN